MTTEDDFHARLDAAPADWQTRLVFADWLDERGDPRAGGYRALGTLRLSPSYGAEKGGRVPAWWLGDDSSPHLADVRCHEAWSHYGSLLPKPWFDAIETGDARFGCWRRFYTRRAAEDAAASAFAGLPAARQTELLDRPAGAA